MWTAKITLSPETIGKAGNLRLVCKAFGVQWETDLQTDQLVFTLTSETRRPLLAALADHYGEALDAPGVEERLNLLIWRV